MTKPEDVPQDTLKAAQAVQDAAAEECRAERFFYGFGSGHAKEVLDRHIARAIMAEREACAQVAECEAAVWDESHQLEASACLGVANAIRNRGSK